MLQGLYSVAAAMEMASRNHDIIADNLANVATPGFRRQSLIFEATADNSQSDSPGDPDGARRPNAFTRINEGPIQQTDNPLDVALSGNGFFTLQGPNGPVYTRNGSFTLNPAGQLVSRSNGYAVLGPGGAPITIQSPVNSITIGPDGSVSANGSPVARLGLARFTRVEELRRVGTTLFQGDNPETPAPGSITVQQGFREGANVQAVEEMVAMMVGMRYYEAAARSMRTLTEAVAQNTRPQS